MSAMTLRPSLALGSLLLALSACPASDDAADTQSMMMTDGSESAADSSASASASGGDDSAALGCAVPEEIDGTDGATMTLQDAWGAACSNDAECVALIGDGAVCLTQAVVFELPLGYCSKPCVLPDANTRVVPDDPMCDAAGGVACVGAKGTFEYCAKLCTDDMQCERDGYICRQMPLIAQAEDPSLCLMPDCCMGTCDPND